jgi:hypothetical protein
MLKNYPFLILLFFTNCLSAQFYDAALSKYEEQFPKEKIHVHFDKTIYNLKETIFYKIYVLEGNDLTTLSKNVYVSWYDTSGNFVNQTVAPLIQSSAKGSFDVPAKYAGNFIHMKAFTRWMLNDDSVFLYEKYILINNGNISKAKELTPHTKVDIFPEGGMLVNGLKTKLAFKATNGFGTPVYLNGVLQNSKNEILDSILVAHDGMGFFHLTPIEGEQYHIHWVDEFLQEGSTTVMPAQKEGVSINVSMGYQKAYVQVERTKHLPDNFKQLKLLVHQNQHLLYSVDFKSGEPLKQKIGLTIDTLPTGIVQFSLFTSDWLPIAERILFVNNHLPEFDAKISFTNIDLNKRGKNTIEVEVSDSISANMSIAITDANMVLPELQSIYSDFLLSSEIRGKVNNPAYYFSTDADSVADHLDLVMLTNGWRKFDWDKLRTGKLPLLKYAGETDYMKLSGNLSVTTKTKLPKNLLLNLAIQGKDSSKRLVFIPVLQDGSFEDKSVFFYDTSRITYSFNDNIKLTLNAKVHFENGLLNPDKTKFSKSILINEHMFVENNSYEKLNSYLFKQNYLIKQMESSTLKEVVVKSFIKTRIQILEDEYPSGMFKGGNAITIDIANDVSANGALGILAYLNSKISINLLNNYSTYFLDDSRLQRGAKEILNSIPFSDIAYVKVFRPPFVGVEFGGNGGPWGQTGGVVAIYTKHKNSLIEDPNILKAVENSVLTGYSVFKEFYNPNYEKPSDNFFTDNRTTLYWNPYVLTNAKNQKAILEFYNNDSCKKLQIVLEGINANGKLMRVVKYLE